MPIIIKDLLISSLGIKTAVAEAMKEDGKDFRQVTFATQCPENLVATVEATNKAVDGEANDEFRAELLKKKINAPRELEAVNNFVYSDFPS